MNIARRLGRHDNIQRPADIIDFMFSARASLASDRFIHGNSYRLLLPEAGDYAGGINSLLMRAAAYLATSRGEQSEICDQR